MRNYKKVSECPEKVTNLLKIINLVPIDVEFSTSRKLIEIYSKKRRIFGDKYYKDTWNEIYEETSSEQSLYYEYLGRRDELIRDEIEIYPKLTEYVFDLEIAQQEFYSAARYLEFVNLRIQMRDITYENTRYAARLGIIDFNWIPLINSGQGSELVTYNEYFINEKGKMDFRQGPIAEALRGHDAIRLRICPICKIVFWAKRTNALTCGQQKCIDDLQNQKKKSAKEIL